MEHDKLPLGKFKPIFRICDVCGRQKHSQDDGIDIVRMAPDELITSELKKVAGRHLGKMACFRPEPCYKTFYK